MPTGTTEVQIMHDSKDLGTPLWGVEEVETRLDAYRDIGGRATQEAKAKQRSRSNYRIIICRPIFN